MLKQRIITALLLLVVILFALFAHTSIYWELLINCVILIGFWEWLRFCNINSIPVQALLISLFAAFILFLQHLNLPLGPIVYAASCVWVVLFAFTFTFTLDFLHRTAFKLVIGVAILSAACLIVIRIQQIEHGPLWVLCMFVCVWAADIGAYFVGKRFGKTKLAPSISPGKTIEGLLGGIAFAMLIYVPLMLLNFNTEPAMWLLLTVLVTVLVSVAGDLFESKLKRFVNLKDSSQVLPGHGGILDRVDSLLAGAPFFASGLVALGYLV